jgi:hypothetical protein
MRALILAAADLLSDEGGENTEYDRALVEVVGTMLDLDLGDEEIRRVILTMLRAVK